MTNPLKPWPGRDTKFFRILETVARLCDDDTDKPVHVYYILEKMKNNLPDLKLESTRMMLSRLKSAGLVDTPTRAMYVVTQNGRDALHS